MISIRFDKAKAESFLDSLSHGKPIKPPSPGGWTGHDMLALAGACFFGAVSQGPHAPYVHDYEKAPKEHREASDESFYADLHAAVEYYGHLTMQVKDHEYDESFEPIYQAVISTSDGKGEVKVMVVSGWKGEHPKG